MITAPQPAEVHLWNAYLVRPPLFVWGHGLVAGVIVLSVGRSLIGDVLPNVPWVEYATVALVVVVGIVTARQNSAPVPCLLHPDANAVRIQSRDGKAAPKGLSDLLDARIAWKDLTECKVVQVKQGGRSQPAVVLAFRKQKATYLCPDAKELVAAIQAARSQAG